MRIRGFSSANSTSALVLIDGVEGDLALVNADDIASISVLKDAAACAIYGARAAAGVVLVTTKNGTEGKAKVTYNGYFAFNTPGNMPERLPAWEEQNMINIGRMNNGGKVEWNDEQSGWVGNPNFNYRPNNSNGRWDLFEATNWVEEGTRDFTTQQNHTVAVSGGTKNLNYMVSGKYYTKNGLLRYGPDANERWSLNTKVNAKLNKYVTLGTLVRYQSTRTAQSSYGAGGIFNLLYSTRGRQPIVRYDGSSRLAPDKRWKVFPSVSAAWRLSQENFLKGITWLSNLKLRASWGQLGNGAVLGMYDYIPTINNGNYMGEKFFYQKNLASTDKTWETISTTNIGVDFGALNNRLTASFDYYWKVNDDMLSSLQMPHVIGIGVPNVNVGKLKTWGWDFEIAWRDKIKDFSYQVSFNLSDSQNRLEKYDGANVISEGNRALLEGYEMNTIWGYKTDGYWTSRNEYLAYKEAHPGYKSFNDGKVSGGDVKYLAQGNPDHQIGAGSGTKEDHGDLVYLGNSNARYLYGFNISAQWKGFDFSMMFQGVGKRKIMIDAAAIAPFYTTYQMPWTIHRDYWTEDNQDAFWPRLYDYKTNNGGENFNFRPSDKWVQDASYLRLKNITLGYTIPYTKKYVNSVRVYITGNDIWEHSDLLKVFDPEAGNNVGRNYYPFFRTWAFGVNITF